MLTVAALATGVALVCAFDVANRGVLTAFGEILDTMGGRAALQVTTGGDGGAMPLGLAFQIEKVAGVTLAVPVVAGTAFLTDGSGEMLAVHGMDVVNPRQVDVYEQFDREALLSSLLTLHRGRVLLTRRLAERRGLRIGDSIEVQGPHGRRGLVVGGLLEPRGVASIVGDSLAIMGLDTAQRLFTRLAFVTRIDVVVAPDADRNGVSAAIAALLPAGLRVEAPVQRKADLERAIRALQRLLQAVSLLALIEAFLVAFNSLSTAFTGRGWQLGMLQAIGMRPRRIQRMLVIEAVLLGVAGITLGVPIGIVLGQMLLPWITAATALNVMRFAPPTALAVDGWALTVAAALGIAGAALAAVLPARRAIAMGVAAVIRTRGVEPSLPWREATGVGLTLTTAAVAAAAVLEHLTRDATWGLAVTALAPLGVVLVARPFARPVLRALERGLRGVARPLDAMAATALRQAPGRTALTIATLGIGVGSVLWLRLVASSFERSVIDAHMSTTEADLVISSPHVASGVNSAPIDGTLVTAIRDLPGVAVAIGNRVVDWEYAGGPIALDTYDEGYFTTLGPRHARLIGVHAPDVWRRLAAGEGALVSSNFAYNFGRRTGDTLTLTTPTGALSLPITGVISHLWSPRGTVVISRGLYERHWLDDSVTRVFAQLADGADAEAVRAAVVRSLGDRYDLQVFSGVRLVGYFAAQARRAFAGVDLLAALMLAIVLAAAGETLGAAVAERTWELGALRALGVRRRALQRMIVVEAILLGTLGLALALALGVGLGAFWVGTTFTHLLGWVLEWHVPWAWLTVMAVLTLASCALGAWLPARRVVGLDPAVALRGE